MASIQVDEAGKKQWGKQQRRESGTKGDTPCRPATADARDADDQVTFLDIMSKRRASFWASQAEEGMPRNKIMDAWRKLLGAERTAALAELKK